MLLAFNVSGAFSALPEMNNMNLMLTDCVEPRGARVYERMVLGANCPRAGIEPMVVGARVPELMVKLGYLKLLPTISRMVGDWLKKLAWINEFLIAYGLAVAKLSGLPLTTMMSKALLYWPF
jgi:hypothetical protein